VGFISPPCPGQHRRLRGISMPATLPPCSSLRISFVKNSCRSITGWRLHSVCSRSPMQRHDVENVASAGATPAASTSSQVPGAKCQVSGEGAPDPTSYLALDTSHFIWSRSHSRPAPGFYPDMVRLQLPPAPPILRDGVISNSSLFESEVNGANPFPATNRSPLAQNQSGSLTNCGRWRVTSAGHQFCR
jgi:hypothetical protein